VDSTASVHKPERFKTLKIIALYILFALGLFVIALAIEAIEGGKGYKGCDPPDSACY